jgi:hypothetical protein
LKDNSSPWITFSSAFVLPAMLNKLFR